MHRDISFHYFEVMVNFDKSSAPILTCNHFV